MKTFRALAQRTYDALHNETMPGALRTKKTHTIVAPRRFRPPEQRFWGRHPKLQNALVALTTFSVVYSVHAEAMAQQQPGGGFRAPARQIAEGAQTYTLPADRWAGEIYLRSDPGALDVINLNLILNALAGALLGIANFMWNAIRGVAKIAFNLNFISRAANEINEITAVVGRWLLDTGLVYVVAIAVLVMAITQGMKGATTSIFKTVLGAILPLGLLFLMVNAAIVAESKAANANEDVANAIAQKAVGSPGWLMFNLIKLTDVSSHVLDTESTNGRGLSGLVYESNTLSVEGREFAACADYVDSIHNEAQLYGELRGAKSQAIIDSTISSLWERSVLVPWMDSQFGRNNDIGSRMFCHLMEENSDVAPVVRWDLLKKSYGPYVAQRIPGGVNTQEGDWKKGPYDNYYANGDDVQHADNQCREGGSRAGDPRLNGSGYFDAANAISRTQTLESLVSLQATPSCPDGKYPENVFKVFNPGSKDDDEANWTAFAWCKWKVNAPSAKEVFRDPGNTEFTNVWAWENVGDRTDPNAYDNFALGTRLDIGVNEEQSCNQWWDYGNFSPRNTSNSDGIFKFLKLDFITQATTANGVNSSKAATFLASMNGHTGITPLILGFYTLVTAFFYGFAIIGIALYVMLAQIQLFLAFALFPIFLLAGAIPHPKAKALFKGSMKMIVIGLFAKTLAASVLILLLLLITIMTKLITSFSLGSGDFGALWTALAPLVSLFAIRRIPGVKEMTTIRGAIKGTKQRISRTARADGGIGAPQRGGGFIRNAARQSARSFGYGLIGTSPYAARKLGNNLRQKGMDKIRGRKGAKGEKTKDDVKQDAAETVRGSDTGKDKTNKAPPPPPNDGVPPHPTNGGGGPGGATMPVPAGSGAAGAAPINGSTTGPVKTFGWSALPSGLDVPSSYFDAATGKPKGDTRAPTQEEVQRRSDQVVAMDVKTRQAVDPSQTWNQHGASFEEINRNLEQMSRPDTVKSGAPSATAHAASSQAQYGDLAGGVAHQDAGANPAALQTVFSTVDPTGQEQKRSSFDATADAIAAAQGMGMSGGGMFLPGQQRSQQSGPIFTGAPGQDFSTMVRQMNADAAKDSASSATLAAANAMKEAAKRIERSTEKAMDGQKNILQQGMNAQTKSNDAVKRSIQDIPRKDP